MLPARSDPCDKAAESGRGDDGGVVRLDVLEVLIVGRLAGFWWRRELQGNH